MNIFIIECPEVSVSHLRRVRSQTDQGEAKYERLMKDIKLIEIDFNFKILPEVARIEENTKPFTKEEQFKDLVANGKYNKK